MTIKDDIKQMFWEPAIDYANSIVPITFETDEEMKPIQEKWDAVHNAYGKGVEDVLEFISNNYDVRLKIPTKHCNCKDPDRDLGQIYCKKCHKDISEGRMRYLVQPGEKFNIPVKEDEVDEARRRLRREIDYENLCARATLYPGKSIEEVKELQFIERIKESYEFVNTVLCNTMAINTEETRRYVIDTLQKRLEFDAVVICNEENNPPEIIDKCLLIAKVLWNPHDGKMGQKYVEMIFGNPTSVSAYQNQQMLDNETFKFIQKGI